MKKKKIPFRQSLVQIAELSGHSFKDVVDVASQYAAQGLKVSEILKRTRDTLILARETDIDTKTAYTDLTVTVNTFNSQALDSTTKDE